jgi:hypothetical protein
MKSLSIALVAAAAFTVPAHAQSLTETHERVWHPAGKTPMLTYSLRNRPACTADASQAGNQASPAAGRCATAASRPAARERVAAATAARP